MKVFDKKQEKELKKIAEYIVSKDTEISKLGIQCLRKSTTYRKLRPASLFYYATRSSNPKVRLSTFINQSVYVLHSNEANEYTKTIIRTHLSSMFQKLLGDEVYKYFRREFINTAKIL
jgi:hypothetical protein